MPHPFQPFHSIFSFFSTFLILQTISFHSIFFFNFSNPYIISLNLNHSYHLEIRKIKSFLYYFSKPFQIISNHFFHPKNWDRMGKMVTPNKGLILCHDTVYPLSVFLSLPQFNPNIIHLYKKKSTQLSCWVYCKPAHQNIDQSI